jgi:putative cell wall-binding protein
MSDFEHDEFEEVEGIFIEEEETDYDYEQTLKFTQNIRRKIVNKQMEKGVPSDLDTVNVLLKALKDMDSTAINDRRNTIDEGNADTARRVADDMAEFVKNHGNPFMRNAEGDPILVSSPTLNPSRLPQIEHAQDEAHIGTVTETEEEFNRRMEPVYKKRFDEESEGDDD